MKKTFCDICGTEFDPNGDARRAATSGPSIKTSAASKITPGKYFDVDVKIGFVARHQTADSQSATNAANGANADVCGQCSWELVNQIDPKNNPLPTANKVSKSAIMAQQMAKAQAAQANQGNQTIQPTPAPTIDPTTPSVDPATPVSNPSAV